MIAAGGGGWGTSTGGNEAAVVDVGTPDPAGTELDAESEGAGSLVGGFVAVLVLVPPPEQLTITVITTKTDSACLVNPRRMRSH